MGSDADIQNLYTFKTLRELKGKVIVKSDSKIDELRQHGNPLTQNVRPQPPVPNHYQLNNYTGRGPFPSDNFTQKYQQFQEYSQNYNIRKEQFGNNLQKELYLPLQEMTKVTALFKSPTGIDAPNSTAYECTSLTN
jgi:hypothetical protein